MTELPWVLETRLAPGQRRRRNPVWGILAFCTTVICVVFFLVEMAAAFGRDIDTFAALLPIWGVLTLLSIGLAVTAFAKRGATNITLGALAMLGLVLANPVLALIIGTAGGFI